MKKKLIFSIAIVTMFLLLPLNTNAASYTKSKPYISLSNNNLTSIKITIKGVKGSTGYQV